MVQRTPRPGELDPIEMASRDELQALQLERMQWTLRHAYENVPHYRASFDAAGVHPSDLKTLSDLASACNGTATVLGGPAECPQRPKCQAGLVQTYGFQAGSFSSLDAGGPQTKNALKTGTISVGLVFSSDGALAAG